MPEPTLFGHCSENRIEVDETAYRSLIKALVHGTSLEGVVGEQLDIVANKMPRDAKGILKLSASMQAPNPNTHHWDVESIHVIDPNHPEGAFHVTRITHKPR